MIPGIYRDMDSATYFGDPCPEPSLSQSIAKVLIERSPLHAKMEHPRLCPPSAADDDQERYDKAKAIGNAAHKLMLGRGKDLAIICSNDFRNKAAKEERDAAYSAGLEPVLEKHLETATEMTAAALSQISQIPGCVHAFDKAAGDSEVVAVACEEGLWLRTMIDWITPDLREVWDFKTSGMSASPYATGRLMASAGWHVQAAMHERILDAIDPDSAGRRRFFYVCQENETPYALTVNEIGESALTIGRKQIQYAVDAWRRCLQCNSWPAYPQRIIIPELPAWSESGWMDRETSEYDARQVEPNRRAPMLKSLMGG